MSSTFNTRGAREYTDALKAFGRTAGRSEVTIGFYFTANAGYEAELKNLPPLAEYLVKALRELVAREFRDQGSTFATEFRETTGPDYWPKARGGQHVRIMGKFFDVGFQDLFQLMTESNVTEYGAGAQLKMGEMTPILRMPLNVYMPVESASKTASPELNSFFLASEWGTGISENVKPFPARLEGPSKDTSGDGSWWLGNSKVDAAEKFLQSVGEGTSSGNINWLGQKGRHFLYDEEREFSPEWEHYVERLVPEYIRRALGEYMKHIAVHTY